MEEARNITTIVTARAGSQRCPGKNVSMMAGKRMVEYTIDAANKSELIAGTCVVLSTDEPELLKMNGVRYIRNRPKELATATASQVDVVMDAVKWFDEQGHQTDTVILLQPTSPLRTGADIDGALQQYMTQGVRTLVSVAFVQEHPLDMIDGSGNILKSRQENYLFLSGAIYIINMELLRTTRRFYHPGISSLYFMPKWRSIDVDDEEDFIVAEKIMLGGRNAK
jgi:CMP-N,N'-diacetyllegionaminic acid synthase